MTPVFLDTAYFISLFRRSDAGHLAAKRFSKSNARGLITTSAVLLELGSAFSNSSTRYLFNFVMDILDDDDVEIVPVESDLLKRAIYLFNSRQDKYWSLADCASFVVMADRGISDAATTDRHFEQAGFVALLRNFQPDDN